MNEPLTIDRLLSDLKKRRLKWILLGKQRMLVTAKHHRCPLRAWARSANYSSVVIEAGMYDFDRIAVIEAADNLDWCDRKLRRKMLRALRTK
jgi:hypothetical protein